MIAAVVFLYTIQTVVVLARNLLAMLGYCVDLTVQSVAMSGLATSGELYIFLRHSLLCRWIVHNAGMW